MSATAASTTDWLTAIGTVGTLTATVIAFAWDRFKLRRRERRAQATMISGWTDSVKQFGKTRALHVLNMSDEPVYNVNVFMQNELDRDPVSKDIITKPIKRGDQDKTFLSVLPARQLVSWQVDRKEPADKGPRTCPRVALMFSDRSGDRWMRDWDGKLRLHEDDFEAYRYQELPTIEPPVRTWITSGLGVAEQVASQPALPQPGAQSPGAEPASGEPGSGEPASGELPRAESPSAERHDLG